MDPNVRRSNPSKIETGQPNISNQTFQYLKQWTETFCTRWSDSQTGESKNKNGLNEICKKNVHVEWGATLEEVMIWPPGHVAPGARWEDGWNIYPQTLKRGGQKTDPEFVRSSAKKASFRHRSTGA